DHGTAFGIAGKRRARVDSMLEAVKLASRLARRSR
ncbi:MAG: 4-hydroxythreonine-4-phosphate dehydrogenase PdxA, partial [Verrucomicrobiota bacterium]